LAAVFGYVRAVNRLQPSGKDAVFALEVFKRFDQVLGIVSGYKEEVVREAEELVRRREGARKRKDYQTADRLREQLRKMGFVVEDTPAGPRLKRRI
jgi:cysteinyl-tRNA synthetase